MRAAYLAVLLAACAAPVPRQYAQGVPVAPRAPAFDPVFEAPTDTGHPGYVGPVENLPRSPYTRVLPQTPKTRREPGVWAAKDPDDPIEFVLIMGLPVSPATVNPEARTAAKICADSINAAAVRAGRSVFPASMPPQVRRCAVARMFWQCSDHWSRVWEMARREALRSNKAMETAWRETLTTAKNAVKSDCGFTSSDAFEEWLRPIAEEWSRAHGSRE